MQYFLAGVAIILLWTVHFAKEWFLYYTCIKLLIIIILTKSPTSNALIWYWLFLGYFGQNVHQNIQSALQINTANQLLLVNGQKSPPVTANTLSPKSPRSPNTNTSSPNHYVSPPPGKLCSINFVLFVSGFKLISNSYWSYLGSQST